MSPREIAIALTGKCAAEQSLRSALLALIAAEATVLARDKTETRRLVIVTEAETFHQPYCWEGVRNFGEPFLRIEEYDEPQPIEFANLEFKTVYGGFLLVPVAAPDCEIFLDNEAVEIAERGDTQGMLRYVEQMVEEMLKERRARVLRVRERLANA